VGGYRFASVEQNITKNLLYRLRSLPEMRGVEKNIEIVLLKNLNVAHQGS
jgi:hypothetical protein